MNVYEEAHRLAQAVRESEEYKQYDSLKKTVESNPELDKMIKDFETKQIQMQAKQMAGEPVEGMAQAIQELYQIIAKDPTAAAYMSAQMRFSIMMSDVYKILADVMGIGNPAQI